MNEFKLNLTQTIAASPEQLFHAWVDTAVLTQWFRINKTDVLIIAENDLRTGGDYRLDVTLNGDGSRQLRLGGLYHEITPPHRLAFTWRWSLNGGAEAEDTYVELSFSETQAGQTRLTVLHDEFLNEADRDWHAELWQSILVQLAAFAATIAV